MKSTTMIFSVLCLTTLALGAKNCFNDCAVDFADDLVKKIGSNTVNELISMDLDAVLGVFADKNKFNHFCGAFNLMESCVNPCPPSFFKTLMQSGGDKIIKYFCVSRRDDILRYMPCVKKVDRKTACQSQCTAIDRPNDKTDDAVEGSMADAVLSGRFDDIQRLTANACEYMHCSLDCDIPAINAKCTKATGNLILDLVHNTFTHVRTLAIGTGLVAEWPDTCTSLQNYTTQATGLPIIIPIAAGGPPLMGNDAKQAEVQNSAHSSTMHAAVLGMAVAAFWLGF